MKYYFLMAIAIILGVANTYSQCPTGSVSLNSQEDVDAFATNFPSCTTIDGSLFIITDFSGFPIFDLSGLSNIDWVQTNLIIDNNPNLTNLAGLQSIRSIGSFGLNGGSGGKLEIRNNEQLTDISDLVNADFGELIIRNNFDLSNCAISNVCSFINSPYTNSSNYQIEFNALGCFDESDLLDACEASPGCPVGDVVLTSNSEITTFSNTYRDCEEINGNFIIDGSNSTITNQAINLFLPKIKKITGDVIIKNTELTTTNYLNGVSEIGGDFQIINNRMFGVGLDNLITLGGSLVVTDNSISASIDFDKLSSIGNELIISNNPNLTNLTGLEVINTVNGNLIKIGNNTALNNLEGLQNIQIPTSASLIIQNNTQLSICNQQSICSFLEGDGNHTINGNSTGCNDKTQILDACSVVSICPDGNIAFTSQTEVDQFVADFPNCIQVNGNFTINSSNGPVTDLSGLSNIESIIGNLVIDGNTDLTNLSGFENLQLISGRLVIEDNPLISNLSGFQNLANISSFLIVRNNNNLINFDGLENLTSIGDLSIDSNPNLVDILALQNVNTINGGQLGIRNNPSLVSLDGIENISDIIRVIIDFNPNVSICSFQNICQAIENNSFSSISGNAVGCENKAAVSIVCGNTSLVVAAIINGSNILNINEGESVTLTHSSTNYDFLLWNSGNGETSTADEVIFTYDTAGTYTVSLEARNNTRGGDFARITIIVAEPGAVFPTAIINGNSTLTINEGETINLTQSSTNFDSLLWYSGDDETSTDNQVSFTYNTAGTYVVTLEATNADGSDVAEIIVIVNEVDVVSEDCEADTLIYTSPNPILDGTHKKIKDWILFPDNNIVIEVESNTTSSFIAGNYIDVKTDFKVEAGAEFLLDIKDCGAQNPEPVDSTVCGLLNNLLGGNLEERIYSMEVTNDGGYILAGVSTSSENGDVLGTNAGGEDFWIVKLSRDGAIEWSKLLGHEFSNAAYSIIQTSDGNYVFNGLYGLNVRTIKLDTNGDEIWNNDFTQGSDFGYVRTDIIETSTGDFVGTGYSLKTVPNGINYAGFVYKLNNDGALEWEKELPFRQFSATEAANGNYILCGYTNSIGVFGSTDIVLTEFNTDGTYISDKSYGTSFGELAQEIQSTNDGGYIIGGTISENDNYNYLIIKVNSNGTKEWQNIYGGDGREYLYSIAQAADGGYVLGGYSETSNNGDITKTTNGGRDFWIVKLDASGNIEWENLVGSSADDIPRSVRQAADGGYVVAGYTANGTGGDLIEESNGGQDGWFLKLNANGEIEETVPCDTIPPIEPEPVDSTACGLNNLYGGFEDDYVEYMEVTADGGYIMAGYSVSSQSGDVPNSNAGANDFWVMKLSENGEIDWSKLYGAGDQDKAYSIRQTTDGGYVVAGTSLPTDSIDYVGSVIKLDSNGDEIWNTPLSNPGLDLTVREIIETNDGGYMAVGYFSDGTLSNSFTIKLDANGELTGARSYGISNALSIDQAPNGNYYLSGYDNYTTNGVEDNIWIAYLDENEADIIWQNIYGLDSVDEVSIDGVVLPDGKFVAGGSTEESGNYDYQIFKVDTTGNIVWATVIGGDGRDIVYSIESTNDGGFIVGGYSDSSNSGDVDMTNNGGRDFWIVKLNSAGSVEWKNLIGGSDDDYLRSVHQTEDGGYIVAGNSKSSNSGDVDDGPNGLQDVWFVKLKANGEIEASNDCN